MHASQAPALRQLAKDIRELAAASDASGTALEILKQACDHLECRAFYFETLHKAAKDVLQSG